MARYQFPKLNEREGTIAFRERMHLSYAWEELCLNAFDSRDWKGRANQQLDCLIKAKKNPELLRKKPADEDTNRFRKLGCMKNQIR